MVGNFCSTVASRIGSLAVESFGLATVLAIVAVCPVAFAAEPPAATQSLFNGRSLDGWDGNPELWSVENGEIVGRTSDEKPLKANSFLIWRGGEVSNFKLTLDYKMEGGNSGVQYRSFELPDVKWGIGGYQADIDSTPKFTGINYGEKFRGILCQRGQKTVVEENGKPKVIEQFGDAAELQNAIHAGDWNHYEIIADGFTFTHKINGQVMSICTDEDTDVRREKGLLALQIHVGPAMTVRFKNIELTPKGAGVKASEKTSRLELRGNKLNLDGQPITPEQLTERIEQRKIQVLEISAGSRETYSHVSETMRELQQSGVRFHFTAVADVAPAKPQATEDGKLLPSSEQTKQAAKADIPPNAATGDVKKVLFIAGKPSHGYGAHEHKAGCMLLAKSLASSGLPLKTEVVTNGWPSNEDVLDGVFRDVDCVVIYADGGPRHPAMEHLDKLRELADAGVGIVCLHYAVEIPKGKPGDTFLDAIGGYFEADWSVNPHWVAAFEELPQHPIANGVEPFKIDDEWYYHMRFTEDMAGVTPILTDLPTEQTLSRPDGPHSGNPAVRKAVASKQPQHVAWAYEDGGQRGFGFTGGHYHWNWGHDEFRQLVLNAIVWSAHLDVPKDGVPVQSVSVSELEANQDEDQPKDYNPARIQAMLRDWNRK